MKVTCQAKECTTSAEIPERPLPARKAALAKAGFVYLMTADASIPVCADCRAKLAKRAVALAELLQGQEVPLWQLIPEAQRGSLKGEDLRRGRRT